MKRKSSSLPCVLLCLLLAAILVAVCACGASSEESSQPESSQNESSDISSETTESSVPDSSENDGSSDEQIEELPSSWLTVTEVQGGMTVIGDDGMIELSSDFPLTGNYSFDIGANASVKLMVEDEKKVLMVGPGTLTTLAEEDGAFVFTLEQGDIFFCFTGSLEDEHQIFIKTEEVTLELGKSACVVRRYNNQTFVTSLNGTGTYYNVASEENSWRVNEWTTMLYENGEKQQLSVLNGDVPDFVINEIQNNDLVKDYLAEKEEKLGFLTEEEILAIAEQFVGTYEYTRMVGSKGGSYEYDMEISYLLKIWITEDGHLHVKVYESDEVYAAIEAQNEILKNYEDESLIEHYDAEIDMAFIRLRGNNQLIFPDFPVRGIYLGTDGNLSQTENNDNRYQRVGD